MKRKYFVRGLGVGILFGALIMFAAYMTSGKNRMSDEDVIKRAQELGMVKQSEYVLESDVTSQETTTEEITTDREGDNGSTNDNREGNYRGNNDRKNNNGESNH